MSEDRALPRGTVAFLFTDIEGSTALWERDRAGMECAVARHLELLKAAVVAHGGYPFKVVGDAVQAAFDTAPAAIAAAADAQRALAAEPWTELGGRPLRVRMAVHVGQAEPADGDYLAPSLNRLARLLAAGHGGQVLVSHAAGSLAEGRLPEGAVLVDLGVHRLRDLLAPERIHQLRAPGLEHDFAPLRTLDARSHNLPIAPTPLVDRVVELADATDMLRAGTARWLTLSGPGGVGKSRLALQIAADLIDRFADGVVLVPLDAVRDPALVSSAVAAAMGLREGGGSLGEEIAAALGTRAMLLVIDNVEHVAEAAPWLAGLLERCPHLAVLATSRVRLDVRAEHLLPLTPLDVPSEDAASFAEAAHSPAVALFVARARAVRPDFVLNEANADAVAAICRKLDGLPLALELAAARVALLPPTALLDRLAQPLAQLAGGGDRPERHQTMRATIAWSHELLDDEARVLFRRLAVFRGGFTLEAMDEVCGPQETVGDEVAVGYASSTKIDLLPALTALVDGSLVRSLPLVDGVGEPRFAMLGTVAAFAREQLDAGGELRSIAARYVAHYRALAQAARAALVGTESAAALASLDAEQDNVRASLQLAAEMSMAQEGVLLAGAVWRWWYLRGRLHEGRVHLERALAAVGDVPASARAQAETGAGVLAWSQGDFTAAEAHHRAALASHGPQGPVAARAAVLNNLAILEMDRGDHDAARDLLSQARALLEASGDNVALAGILHSLGALEGGMGDNRAAQGHFETSLALHRGAGNTESVVSALHNLAEIDLALGDTAAARRRIDDALVLVGPLGDRASQSALAHLLGLVDLAEGELEPARIHVSESLRLRMEMGERRGISRSLVTLAVLAVRDGEPLRAARLLGAAEALREKLGASWSKPEAAELATAIDAARAAGGTEAFDVAWHEGAETDLVALANAAAGHEAGEARPMREVQSGR